MNRTISIAAGTACTQEETEQKNSDFARITACILDVGEIMLHSGAEVGRVEDTISRMGKAYGFLRVDVLTIMNCIIVTVEDKNGVIMTQTRRVLSISTDMERVRACNALSRRVCTKPLSKEAFAAEIREIREHTKCYGRLQNYVIYMLTASAMAVFFGGDGYDLIAAGLAAVLMRFVHTIIIRAKMQNFVTNFIESFAVGIGIYLLVLLGIGHHYDKIAMGNIMLLISGSGLMTSVRDMINNDLISGMMGFLSATIGAAAIALGFVTAHAIFM